jgi:hypothetical protein
MMTGCYVERGLCGYCVLEDCVKAYVVNLDAKGRGQWGCFGNGGIHCQILGCTCLCMLHFNECFVGRSKCTLFFQSVQMFTSLCFANFHHLIHCSV